MLLALACTFVTDEEWKARLDADCTVETWYLDEDGDGFGGESAEGCEAPEGALATGGDCNDSDAAAFPGATEQWYDGVDQDCAGGDDNDQDGDGYGVEVDCMDGPLDPVPALAGDCSAPTSSPDPASVNPGATDIPGDGVDADCSGTTDFDADEDGFSSCDGDCDDEVAAVNPDAEEVWYDGVDDDCDGNLDDQDGDGFAVDLDCDDRDPGRFPGAIETWYDGVDQDCDGNDDDQDYDGYDEVIDCDDLDAAVSPGAVEVWYDGVDQDCDGIDDDRDGDGFVLAVDCDDDRADVNPAATERCGDEVDDNCDGTLDEVDAIDCTSFFVDEDGDGFGGEGTECRCEQGAGLALVGGDCDDVLASINPGAEESCDGPADENCSGEADENGAAGCISLWSDVDGDGFGIPAAQCACEGSPGTADNADDCDDGDASVHGPSSWYADADDDGWGDAATILTACTQPESSVDNDEDCNDAEEGQRPDAPEDCATAYDDDCDGDTDDPEALNTTCWYGDLDRDGHGAGSCVTSCTATGLYDSLTADDCDDARPSINPDAVELCGDGVDQDCDGSGLECAVHGVASVATADSWLIGGGTAEYAGTELAVDDAGFSVGAPGADGGLGRVYLWVGDSSGTRSLPDAALLVSGTYGGDGIGTALGFVDDVDGDGDADLGVGAPYSAAWVTNGGGFAIVSSGSRGTVGWLDSGVGVMPDSAYQEVGADFGAAGDLDGDTQEDLVVGAPGANGVGVYPARPAGMLALGTGSAWLKGESSTDRAGEGLEAGQDVDGDGWTDLVVAAPDAASYGRVYVVLGPVTTGSLADAEAAISGDSGAPLGAELALADIDGDGAIDLLAGAPDAIYMFAPLSSSVTGDAFAVVTGDAVGLAFATGDLDSDGLDDLALGSRSSAYISGGGTAAVFYAPIRGTASISAAAATRYGGSEGDYAGAAVACSPDTNADGYGDLLVGATGEDSGGDHAGSVYIFLGGGL